jgi:hypothetical protein
VKFADAKFSVWQTEADCWCFEELDAFIFGSKPSMEGKLFGYISKQKERESQQPHWEKRPVNRTCSKTVL